MAKRMDWIPTREEKLLALMAVWLVKLADTTLQAAYDWVAAECAAVIAAINAFLSARAAYQEAPTKANHTEKEELKKTAVEAMRKFARERVRFNPKMNDGQKQDVGVNATDTEPTPVQPPDAGPESEAYISAQSPGVVKVRYLGAKPYGVDRIEIAYAVSPTPIDSPDQLPLKETFSRNPWEHTFGHEERAKKMYYSLRYLTKDKASHWSDVREVIIP
ncbi:MAG: hypothetical protein LBC51_09145 [Treponema sp.]|jgi:hypothetical protein|nr:hypothetical protein [Treponema sp.]